MEELSGIHELIDWGLPGFLSLVIAAFVYYYRDSGKRYANDVQALKAEFEEERKLWTADANRLRAERDAAQAKIDELRKEQIEREKQSSDRKESLQADIERLRAELRDKE